MDFLKEFEKIMADSATFALATSMDNTPNVRITSFYKDAKNNSIVYFSTVKQSPKTVEISQNNKVAFTTIPNGPGGVVRVTNATIQKSDLTVDDIKDGITKKFPGFAGMLASAGTMLEIYEIHFNEAIVAVGQGNVGNVTF